MKVSVRALFLLPCVALLAAFVLSPLAVAHAQSLNINYYTISSSDPDANNLTFGNFSNEVQNTLGSIAGMPVLNTIAYNPSCTGGCISSSLSLPTNLLSDGEITYWDPTANSYSTLTSTSTISLPVNIPDNFFPPNGIGTNGDGGSAGYQAAELFGTLDASTTEDISFSIGADDMAFAYLDGQLVCDLGGIHGDSPGTCTTPGQITAGDHTLEVFFTDMNQSQSALSFSVETQGVTTTGTPGIPEPSSIVMLGTGLLAAAGMVRRRILG
jgi:fibro-slime domain-containing protein